MSWEGEDETIPVMGGAIFEAKFVVFARDLRKAALILSR